MGHEVTVVAGTDPDAVALARRVVDAAGASVAWREGTPGTVRRGRRPA